jgi:hypothetical protein
MSPPAEAASNIIPLSNGKTGTLVSVTAIHQPGGAAGPNGGASVVIDAADRFGNIVRRTKTAAFNAGGLAAAGRTCLAAPLGCAAISAIVAAASIYDYVSQDGDLYRPTTYPTSSPCDYPYTTTATTMMSSAGYPVYSRNLPCTMPADQLPAGKTSGIRDLSIHGESHSNFTANWTNLPGDEVSTLRPYYISWFASGDTPPASVDAGTGSQPITDNEWAALMASDPTSMQSAPGEWPEAIWEPVPWDESIDTASDPLSPTTTQNVNVENWPYPTEPAETLLSVAADVTHDTVDLSDALSFGSGWLPRTCPSDEQFSIMDRQFALSYGLLCNSIETWVHPFFQIAAMLTGIGILIGGIRA